jgi:hypothetical protein
VYLTSALCEDCVTKNVITLAVCIAHLSSAINPMLYAYHMRDIRHAIFRLFGGDIAEASSSVRKTSVLWTESRGLKVFNSLFVAK